MSVVDFLSQPDLKMSKEACAICTPAQFAAIVRNMGENRKMSVFVDFSLPTGYLYFVRQAEYNGEVHTIHGGIDPEGSVST